MPKRQTQEVSVAYLKNQTGVSGEHSVLYCYRCHSTFSANASDYFMCSSDHVFMCCAEPLHLVVRRTIMREVGGADNG